MIRAPVKKWPMANIAAATKFTTSPKNVRKLGFTPVAASAPTILSSSHLLPVPMPPVSVAMRDSLSGAMSPELSQSIALSVMSESYTSGAAGRKRTGHIGSASDASFQFQLSELCR